MENKYLIVNKSENINNEKVFREIKKFETLKQAVGYLMKINELTSWDIVEIIDEFDVIKK